MIKEHKSKYDSALEYLNFGDVERAKKILIELFDIYEHVGKLNGADFYDFAEPMEYFLYFGTFKKLKEAHIKKVPEPVVYYAYQIASIYLEQNDVVKAIEYLERALLFNPICQYVIQELVELNLSQLNYDKAFTYLRKSISYAYTKKQLAFGYKKLGLCYKQKQMFDKAIACFALSDLYIVDIDNKIQIKEITSKVGQIKFTSAEQLLVLFKEDEINYGPSKKVVETCNDFINYAKASKDKKTLDYIAKIAFELTDEKYYKNLLK